MIKSPSEIPIVLQHLQDKQGYVVLAVWLGQKKIGETLDVVATSIGDHQCKTVVVGFSTYEEWRGQYYDPSLPCSVTDHPEDYQYVKVIAE